MKKIILSIVFCSLTSLTLAGQNCKTENAYAKTLASFYALPSSKNLTLLNVKGYQQTTDYTCGPAAAMSLMRYYHMLRPNEMNHTTEMRIAKEMGTSNKVGTNPQQMVSWLQKHGFEVRFGENGTLNLLRDNLKKGIPTIVEWIDWGGHWVVVTGYDVENKIYHGNKDSLFLADPAVQYDNVKTINGINVFNPDRFASMWFDAQLFNPGHLVKGIYIVAVPAKTTAKY